MPNKLSETSKSNVARWLQENFIPRFEKLINEAIQDLSKGTPLDDQTAREVRSHIRQTFINYLLSKERLDQQTLKGGN